MRIYNVSGAYNDSKKWKKDIYTNSFVRFLYLSISFFIRYDGISIGIKKENKNE